MGGHPPTTPSAATTLLATGLPAAPAHGWKLSGAGFGHGAGLSQYGAYGLAQKGAGYRRILAHYYRGDRDRQRR